MKRRTFYVILAILVIAAAAGVVLWRSRYTGKAEETMRSASVQRGGMVEAVSASGSIEPERRVSLRFETPGRVAEVLVQVGERVEAGDALARLDTRQLELQVDQSEAALALAEAQLAQLRAGPRAAEIERAEANLRAAQAQLGVAEANRDQLVSGPSDAQIAAAEAKVASARVKKEVAQDAYDLIEGEGTEKEQANYDLYTAKRELAAAQAELDELINGPDADELRAARANVQAAAAQRDASQAQLDQLLAGPTEEELADAEAQVAQAQAALELAELSLKDAALRAPFDGVVAKINAIPGEMAPTQQPAIVLLDDSPLHITVSVDEVDVTRLTEEQTAQVAVDALPDAVITGTVKKVAPVATLESGVVAYGVVVELAPTEAPIRADMTAGVTIVVEELIDVLRIPTWVVRIDDDTGQTYVHRRIGDEIERVDVELGVRYGGVAQVLAGLSEGDEVVRVEDTTAFDLARR